MKSIKKRVLMLIAAFGVIFSSCANDSLNNIDPGKGNQRQVIMSVQLPGKFTQGATRAMSEAAENNLTKATFVVFTAGGNYAYHKTSTTINGAGNIKSIMITLTTDGGAYDIAVLANLPASYDDAAITAALTGKTIDDIYTALTEQQLTGNWAVTEFIMSGEVRNQTLSSTTTVVGSITLLRSLASVDIGAGWNYTTREWDGISNFDITEVFVYNANNKFSTYPNPAFLVGGISVNKPTLPTGTASIGNSAATALNYADVGGVSGVSIGNGMRIASEIYIGEVGNLALTNPATRPALVLGGKFDGSTTTTYYRLDFAKTNADGTLNTYLDILRNYKYRFNIKEVQGAGYTTPDEAFASKAINIVVNVQPWDQGDIDDVIQNGQYRLGVSPGIFNLDMQASKNTVVIKTDAPKPTVTYSTSATDPDAGAPAWITQGSYVDNGSGSGLDFYKLDFNVTTNDSTPRTAYIFIKAGILPAYVVTVNQSDYVPVSLQILKKGVDGNFVEELGIIKFVQDDTNTAPVAQTYKIKWSPASAKVMVSLSSIGAHGLITWVGDAPNVNEELTSPSGEKEFTVQPASFTDYIKHSFAERKSLITAHLDTMGETALKSVVFQQIVKDMQIIHNKAYVMDGVANKHYVTVKSNVPWRVDVTENISTGTGTPNVPVVDGFAQGSKFAEGDYNLPKGNKIYFTPVNDLTAPAIYMGNLGLDLIDKTSTLSTISSDLLCASGHPQDGKEANSYVLDPVKGAGLLIPVRNANGVISTRGGTTRTQDNWMLGDQITTTGANAQFGARLVWTDAPGTGNLGLADDAAISMVMAINEGPDGYILVIPGTSPTPKMGNAVVAITRNADGTGDILWSYHIWLTDAFNVDPVSGYIIGGHNSGGGMWLDRNLGATTNSSNNIVASYGLHYQWGRKDPFIGNATSTATNSPKPIYDAAGNAVTMSTWTAGNTLLNSVRNPTKEASDWTGSNQTNRDFSWNTTAAITGEKTAYDPCPDGWRIPIRDPNLKWNNPDNTKHWGNDPGDMSAAMGSPWNAAQKGINWPASVSYKGGYYPAAGARLSSVLTNVGSHGYYWSASPYGAIAYSLHFYTGVVIPSFTNTRSISFTIRCVQ